MLTNVSNFGALALDEQTAAYLWQVPLLGMVMVFAVLGLLWGVLAIFKMVFVGKTPKEKKPEVTSVTEVKSPIGDEDLIAVLSAAVAAHQNNDEIVAVLTAAVAEYRAQEGDTAEFRVVAFKRGTSRSWNSK